MTIPACAFLHPPVISVLNAPFNPGCISIEGEAQAVEHCTNPAVMAIQVQLSALLDSPRFAFSWFSSKAGVRASTWG